MKDSLISGVDLNIGSLMRSKYDTYKEYHTSLDNLGNVVTAKGLNQSFRYIKKVMKNFEKNYTFFSCNL